MKNEAIEKSTIVHIPLKQQIVYFVRKYYKEIVEYLGAVKHGDEFYKDIYDGKIWNRYQSGGVTSN